MVNVSQGLAKKWSRDSLDLLMRVVSVKEFPDDKDLQESGQNHDRDVHDREKVDPVEVAEHDVHVLGQGRHEDALDSRRQLQVGPNGLQFLLDGFDRRVELGSHLKEQFLYMGPSFL